VAILWPADQQKHGMKEIEAVGQALGIQIQSLDASGHVGSFGRDLTAPPPIGKTSLHDVRPQLKN